MTNNNQQQNRGNVGGGQTGSSGGNVGGGSSSGGKTGGGMGGNAGGGQEMKFVKRFEMAIMQFVILTKAKQGVTRENLQQTFRGNMQMSSDHFDHCIRQLVSDGHLKEEGNRFTATDDGREDVQKLQHLVLELPQVIGGGQGQSQGQGMTAQRTTGGGMTGGSSGGNVGGANVGGGNVTGGSPRGGTQQANAPGNYGGSTTGNQPNVGSSGKGPLDQDHQDLTRGNVNKGGATSPSMKSDAVNQGPITGNKVTGGSGSQGNVGSKTSDQGDEESQQDR